MSKYYEINYLYLHFEMFFNFFKMNSRKFYNNLEKIGIIFCIFFIFIIIKNILLKIFLNKLKGNLKFIKSNCENEEKIIFKLKKSSEASLMKI